MPDRLGQGAVSEPEPTDAELAAERAREAYLREEADAREKLRTEVVEVMDRYDTLARDALGEDEADRMRALIFRALTGQAA